MPIIFRAMSCTAVTEDSDLLAFNCARVFFKLEPDGWGKEVQLKDLGENSDVSFVNWNLDMFTQFCILCGCDYLKSLAKIGPKRAHLLIQENRSFDKVRFSLSHRKTQLAP